MAENVVHLVLARLPDAPEGTRGISLFLVPKFSSARTARRRRARCRMRVDRAQARHSTPARLA